MLNFDEYNKLSTDKFENISFEEYFGEMEITEEQKENRITLAMLVESMMHSFFALAIAMVEYDTLNSKHLEKFLKEEYKGIIEIVDAPNSYYAEYIGRFAEDIVKTTVENITKDYTLSDARAKMIAVNESNAIYNSIEYNKAKSQFTFKMWQTMEDRFVRHTHREVDNQVKPIDDAFLVGTEWLNFPKDRSLGATGECVNCRCTIKYF